jgi:hypothetical protein
MSQPITRIVFDQKSFPVAPSLRISRMALEQRGIVVYTRGLAALFAQYAYDVPSKYNLQLHDANPGFYLLDISLRGPRTNPICSFEFYNGQSGGLESSVQLNIGMLEDLYNRTIDLNDPPIDEEEYRRHWMIAHFKSEIFEDRLSASGEFWNEFYDQFSNVLRPIYFMRIMAESHHEPQVICVIEGPAGAG